MVDLWPKNLTSRAAASRMHGLPSYVLGNVKYFAFPLKYRFVVLCFVPVADYPTWATKMFLGIPSIHDWTFSEYALQKFRRIPYFFL
jgi:hypothetical protein